MWISLEHSNYSEQPLSHRVYVHTNIPVFALFQKRQYSDEAISIENEYSAVITVSMHLCVHSD